MQGLPLAALAACVLLAGCASTGEQDAERSARMEDTYVPTGSSIARRTVDRASAVKSASKEELENARIMGGGSLNQPQN